MLRPDVFVVVNPVAGRGKAAWFAQRLQSELSARGISSSLHCTKGRGHAEAMIRRELAKGMACVVVCGGDGTVNEAVNALANSEVPLALLPGGRCNDFARALRVPKSPAQTADAILRMRTLRVDLGRIGDKFFATVATLGFDAEVTRIIADGKTQLHGTPAYVLAALRLLLSYDFPHVHIKADFGEFNGRILLAATANTPAYGGGLLIAPKAKLTDGILHMCLIRMAPKVSILTVFPTAFFGGHVFHSAVSSHPVKRAEVNSPQTMWLYADGELMSSTPTVIMVAPQALSVIV